MLANIQGEDSVFYHCIYLHTYPSCWCCVSAQNIHGPDSGAIPVHNIIRIFLCVLPKTRCNGEVFEDNAVLIDSKGFYCFRLQTVFAITCDDFSIREGLS